MHTTPRRKGRRTRSRNCRRNWTQRTRSLNGTLRGTRPQWNGWIPRIIAHRPIRFANRFTSRCVTTCIITHRPIRFASRCAISAFVSIGQKKSQHASSHINRFDSPVDVRYRLLYLLAIKITRIIAHRPIRFASRCAISGFVSIGQKNHNIHHRTSTESIPAVGRAATKKLRDFATT